MTAFVQPVFINGDMHIAPGRLGGKRLAHSYAWGDMERLGLHMAFGHRLPGGALSPLEGSTAPSPAGLHRKRPLPAGAGPYALPGAVRLYRRRRLRLR